MSNGTLPKPVTFKPPFPYFGGKSSIASEVWNRFGPVDNYIEPFCGSMAMLLARPTEPGTETVNDADGFICNFWRAVKHSPEDVAEHADHPVNECDLHARHSWLVGRREDITRRLEGDPEWFDAKIAGWWVWGQCCWIGYGWCSGRGPWHVVDGELIKTTGDGQGVNRQRPHLGDGRGVNRQRPHLGNNGEGVNRPTMDLADYMVALSERLRRVRVCCGDWSRVCGPTVLAFDRYRVVGVFLDPPYAAEAGRENDLYAVDCLSVAHEARKWAIETGSNPQSRIALCGYEGEHEMPDSWECVEWKAHGGMANIHKGGRDGTGNYKRERIWFSPHCQRPTRHATLFDGFDP